MAKAKTISGTKIIVQVGDGASPEVFAAPCGLTTRGFNRTANTNDVVVPDCTDEDAMAWVENDVVSLQAGVTGSGVLDTDALDVWDDWFQSGELRNCRIVVDVPLAQNGRHYAGAFRLTNFNMTGERGSKAQVEVTLASSGPVSKVDAQA